MNAAVFVLPLNLKMKKVYINECDEYNVERIYHIIKSTIEKLDSFNKRLKKAKSVFLKVNVIQPAFPESAITTHPAVIEACIKLFSESYGKKVAFGDSSSFEMFGRTEKVLDSTGMNKLIGKYGVEFINIDAYGKRPVVGREKRKFYISSVCSDFDILVSLPKLKTHMLTSYTGAIKNMMGLVPGYSKALIHRNAKSQKDFMDALVDIALISEPDLCIIDAILGMEGDGPSAGNPVKMNKIIISESPAAADVVASRIMGFTGSLLFNNALFEGGLIKKDEIVPVGSLDPIFVKKPFNTFSGIEFLGIGKYFIDFLKAFPDSDKDRCVKCGLCVKRCPTKVLHFHKGYPTLKNRKDCILCYCCHELCPEKAIVLRDNKIAKAIKWVISRKIRG